MNRVVTDKGTLASGQIVRGAGGTDITYDAAGRRAQVVTASSGSDHRETYAYNLGGELSTVAVEALVGGSYQAAGGSTFSYDAAGRMTHQVDSDASNIVYDRAVTYNEKGQALSETTAQRQGSDTVSASTTTDYGSGTAYALGAPVSVTTTASRNGGASTTSLTSYTYEYFDTPLQSTITYQPDVTASATNTTTISYTGQGVLFSADIHDGRPRLVNYQADALGQVIRRDEDDNVTTTGDPHEVWFRYDGRELGHVSNNGTLETDYAGSIANRGATQGTGPFRNGALAAPSSLMRPYHYL